LIFTQFYGYFYFITQYLLTISNSDGCAYCDDYCLSLTLYSLLTTQDMYQLVPYQLYFNLNFNFNYSDYYLVDIG